MNNQIKINNIVLDKAKLLRFIDNNEKIRAIKFIKDKTNISLKPAKNIVDNLEENPDFYNGENNSIIEPTLKTSKFNRKKLGRHTKGSHIIKKKPLNLKNVFILFLLMVIVFLVYLLVK